jgi:Tfp pilus assembly protein PilN
MMRRIDLLPEAYLRRQRERRLIGLVLVAGLAVLLLLTVWWVRLGLQISDARGELETVQAENDRLRERIAELQQYQDLANEVAAKREALRTVMAGDVDWPVLMTEVAMAVPGEVWLTGLTASAGTTEGAAAVGTETAPIRLSNQTAFGRIQFQGSSLSMPGVAKWLIRQEMNRTFEAVFLNDATEGEAEEGAVGGPEVITFDSTLELNRRAASERFLGGQR